MTNKTNAFTSFLGNTQENYQQSQGTSRPTNVNPPSPKQVQTYLDMCKRKNVTPMDTATMSKQEISKQIETIINMPFPPSDTQKEKINELIAELNAHGVRINISDEKMASLSGGREGTASQLIEFLFKKKQDAGIVDGISDKQVEILVEWFLCPDVPFEDYGINKRVSMPDVSDTAWRLCTATEFEEQIRASINREDASKLIDTHRNAFYEWKKTRISQNQIQFIQTLEQRLANTYVPRESKVTMNHDGEIEFAEASSREQYAPRGYEPMDILQLAQLSYEEARQLITAHQIALADRTSVSAYNDDQQELQDKHGTFNDLRATGDVAHNELEARVREYHKLNDILFALDAVSGMENDVLHAKLSETVLDGKGHADVFAREFVEYMMSTVHGSTFQKDLARLRALCESSDVATQLLEDAILDMIA